jgi:hypothetical protein
MTWHDTQHTAALPINTTSSSSSPMLSTRGAAAVAAPARAEQGWYALASMPHLIIPVPSAAAAVEVLAMPPVDIEGDDICGRSWVDSC